MPIVFNGSHVLARITHVTLGIELIFPQWTSKHFARIKLLAAKRERLGADVVIVGTGLTAART